MAAQKFSPENRAVRSIVKDLSGGQAPKTIFRNAMLSIDTKKKICELHAADPETHTSEALAKMFRVSEQRVLAIIALAELRERHYAEGGAILNDELNAFMEKWYVRPRRARGRGTPARVRVAGARRCVFRRGSARLERRHRECIGPGHARGSLDAVRGPSPPSPPRRRGIIRAVPTRRTPRR